MASVVSEAVMTHETRPSPARSVLGWVGRIVSWLLILSFGLFLLATMLVPRLAGATPYVIETSSMRPTLPPGTLVVVKQPADLSKVSTGTVMTFQERSGDPTVVTHRVVSVGFDGSGAPRFRTQGDANDVPDQGWVLPEQVRGTEWYALPYLGYATAFINDQKGGVLVVLVVIALASYAGRMFVGAAREKRAGGDTP